VNSAEIWYEWLAICPEWAEIDYGDPEIELFLEDEDEIYVVEMED
jgi:hypothetical protein